MPKITNYMVTQTGARRTVTFTREVLTGNEHGRAIYATDAVTYSYGPRDPMPQREGEDAWEYIVPSGETYTHPNKHGCLHMILAHVMGLEEGHTRRTKIAGFINHH